MSSLLDETQLTGAPLLALQACCELGLKALVRFSFYTNGTGGIRFAQTTGYPMSSLLDETQLTGAPF